ncbi:MAG: ATP-binding cassette domain-containing protein [Parafannyhessea sp.]|uniref:ATP-binding cassette domain-containing protein n=1 Tax=Parafannyhessea sp. TaxID=2847324 RepID=UPI003F05652E
MRSDVVDDALDAVPHRGARLCLVVGLRLVECLLAMACAWLLCDSVLVMGDGAAKASVGLTLALFGAPLAWAVAHAAAGWVAASLRLDLELALQDAVAGGVGRLVRADAGECPSRREALLAQGAMADVCRDRTEFVPWLCAAAISLAASIALASQLSAQAAVCVLAAGGLEALLVVLASGGRRAASGDAGSADVRGVDGYLRRDLAELDAYASLGAVDWLLARSGERNALVRRERLAVGRTSHVARALALLVALACLALVLGIVDAAGGGAAALQARRALGVAACVGLSPLALMAGAAEGHRSAQLAREDLVHELEEDAVEPDEPFGLAIHPGDHLALQHAGLSEADARAGADAWGDPLTVVGDVSLDVSAVGLTVLAGPADGGRRAVAALLSGAVRPSTGVALLGGKPLDQLDPAELGGYLTLVRPSDYLFEGSVRQNLRMADPTATEGMMWDVLGAVGLDEPLRRLDGLDTRVLADGANLAPGGRRQLLLARALLRDSAVYVLDDLLDGADEESAASMMRAVRGIARYKAVVISSGRVADAADASVVYVLDGGRVTGSGTSEELALRLPAWDEALQSQRDTETFALRRAQDLEEARDA